MNELHTTPIAGNDEPLVEYRQANAPAGLRTRHQTTAPNSAPTPAVIAIASAPQKVTRHAPIRTPAPPARAATAPNKARKKNAVADIHGIRLCAGANVVTASGSAAPTAKLAADASAAWTGRALWSSEMPSSSRPWGTEGVVRHQLLRHLLRQARLEPSADIDGRQLTPFRGRILFELGSLARQVGILSVRLRMDRDIFPSGH
jgi:hypothetical protein